MGLSLLCLFLTIFSACVFRGSVRGEGNTGESRFSSKSHRWSGSYRCRDCQCVYVHATHGVGQRSHCCTGMPVYIFPMLHTGKKKKQVTTSFFFGKYLSVHFFVSIGLHRCGCLQLDDLCPKDYTFGSAWFIRRRCRCEEISGEQ